MAALPGTLWAPRPVPVEALQVPGVDDPEGWGAFGVWLNLKCGPGMDWQVMEEGAGVLIEADPAEGIMSVHSGEWVVFFQDGIMEAMTDSHFKHLYKEAK